MTEQIGERITEVVGALLPCYYAEAEANEYPFAVYSQVVTHHFSKDGIYKIESDLSLNIVSNVYEDAKDYASQAMDAIASGANDDQFTSRVLSVVEDCQEGIWVITIEYNIRQKS